MIIYSTLPVLKHSFEILLHIPNKAVLEKKEKIEKGINNISCSGDIKPSIGNFELWQTNSHYFVAEIKINIHNMNNQEEKKETNIEKNIYFELQNKIQSIMKTYKINENYIEIV